MWTLNNWDTSEEEYLISLPCKYMSFGYEVGAQGTPHLQGFTSFDSAKTLSAVIKSLPKRVANVQVVVHTEEAIAYTQKEGAYHEHGVKPLTQSEKGSKEIDRWESARTLCKTGRMEEVPADIYMRCYRTCKEIAKDHMPDVDSVTTLEGEWIYGPSGCGKTRGVLERYPKAYLKTANKWWDGYNGEETVLIDDLDENHKCLMHHLKIWGDHKPFLAETKGGMIKIRPKRIICTSNHPIEIMAEGDDLEALKRRYKVDCRRVYPIFTIPK